MKNKFTRQMLMVGAAILFGIFVSAAPMMAQDPVGKGKTIAPPETMAQTMTISGRVTAASESSITVVDDQKVEHTVTISANTKVTKAGKEAVVADVKSGDAVVVVANQGEGESMTAVSVAVT
ncbi:MAG: hypothetical protein ABIP75_01275 [Pyrinomonadaceae bacterium]